MATTTPNFGWAVPTSTDLVKDGAVAIETLGDSIDASLVDLKGGTTGQVLSKTSNTDMDFTWVTDAAGDITGVTAGTGISGGGTSGTVTVTNSMATAITTAGDLIKGTGSGTFDRLGIGSTGQVLTVASGAPSWATPSAGASFVGCFLSKSTSQSISNNTTTTVSFNQESFDTSGFHDNATNNSRITIPSGKAGKYLLTFNTNMDGASAGGREAIFKKNGTAITYNAPGSGGSIAITGFWSPNVSVVADAAVSDYFEVVVYQSSGSAKSIQGDDWTTNSTYFSAVYLGA